jgi:hypothetical protein
MALLESLGYTGDVGPSVTEFVGPSWGEPTVEMAGAMVVDAERGSAASAGALLNS